MSDLFPEVQFPDPEISLADLAWLTALARTLTRDNSDAEDLVQETWIAARKSPPAEGGINRPWLARVLKRFHLRSLRGERRRAYRETLASKEEVQTGSAELVERAELYRCLSDCLLSIEEPYRTTLMRVAFEEFSTARIAELDGVSVSIVRRRIRKGRELFREKMVREHGESWDHWHALLAPYALLPLPSEMPPGPLDASAEAPPVSSPLASISVGLQLVVGLTVLVSIGAYFLTRSGEAVVGEADSSSTELVSEALVTEEIAPVRNVEREPVEVVVAETEPNSGAAESSTSPSSFRLHGSMVVRDEFGVAYGSPNGTFQITIGEGTRDIEVVDGLWETRVAPRSRVHSGASASLDDRAAALAFSPLDSLDQDTELHIVAHYLPATTLTVLDAVTREPLRGLTVVEAHPFAVSHPGPFDEADVIVQGVASPVNIEPRTAWMNTYFVRTEGYPWTRVQLNHSTGDDRELLLRSAESALSVHVEGGALRGSTVKVQPADGFVEFATFPLGEDDRVTIEHLEPGEYRVGVRLDGLDHVDEKVVTLAPGMNDLALKLPPEVPKVRFAGTLTVPAEWGLDEYKIYFSGSNNRNLSTRDMEPVPDRPGTWSFDAGELPATVDAIRVVPLFWSHPISLEQGPANAIEIVVPPPGKARLQLIDGTTGEVLTDESDLEISVAAASYNLDESSNVAIYEASSQSWRFTVPQGEAWIDIRSEQFVRERFNVRIDETEARLERTVRPASHIVFDLHHGDELVPTDIYWLMEIQIEAKDGHPGRVTRFSFTDAGVGFAFNEPGLYEVTFPELEGFVPIPEAVVELQAGQLVRHRVELERAP